MHVQVWGEVGEAMHGGQSLLGSLQHHIKMRSSGEDDGALNHSVHLCKLHFPQRVLPTLGPSPQAFPRLPGKGPLLRFGGATGRCSGCIGYTLVASGGVRSSIWLECSLPAKDFP